MEKPIKREMFSSGLSVMRAEEEGKGSRIIEGTAIVFNQPTVLWRDGDIVYRELIAPEAVPETLLKESDIILSMYHNPEKVLARSKQGKGTLSWTVDGEGVHFRASMPATVDGDTALELVKEKVIDGCSFWAYVTPEGYTVTRTKEGEKSVYTRTIKAFESIRDFTLTHSPAYPQTTVGTTRDSSGSDDGRKETLEAEKRHLSKSWEEIENELNNNN